MFKIPNKSKLGSFLTLCTWKFSCYEIVPKLCHFWHHVNCEVLGFSCIYSAAHHEFFRTNSREIARFVANSRSEWRAKNELFARKCLKTRKTPEKIHSQKFWANWAKKSEFCIFFTFQEKKLIFMQFRAVSRFFAKNLIEKYFFKI